MSQKRQKFLRKLAEKSGANLKGLKRGYDKLDRVTKGIIYNKTITSKKWQV